MIINNNIYKAENKQNTLCDIGRNSSKFPSNNHLIVKTSNKEELVTGVGYELLKMKVLVNDKNGYRLYCEVKKGNIEHPHFHHGRYELFILSGKMLYKNEETGEEVLLEKGDYYCNPPLIKHSSICIEDATMFWLYDKEPDCQCIHN